MTGRGTPWRRDPLTPEQQALACQWQALACREARSWARNRPDLLEEFVGAAVEALVMAARNWDPRRGKFPSCLYQHLRHARKEVFRQATPKGYRITGCLRRSPAAIAARANPPRRVPLLDADQAADHRLSVDSLDGRLDAEETVHELLALLPAPWQEILREHLAGVLNAEIGRRRGVGFAVAARQVREARGLLRGEVPEGIDLESDAGRQLAEAAARCREVATRKGLLP